MNKKRINNHINLDKTAAEINHERMLKEAHKELHEIINSSIHKGSISVRKSNIARVISKLAVSLSIL
jgi:hypothetical protein